MKGHPHNEVPRRHSPPKDPIINPVASKEVDELLLLKTQLQELRHRNQHMEAEIKSITKLNTLKKHTNNSMRHTFKKLQEDMQTLKQQHLRKVQQNLINQQSPVSALIQENGFGVSPFALMRLPSFRYQKKYEADICMACYEELQQNSKCKTLPGCNHMFHAQCIEQYLLVSKQCPACGQNVTFT